MEIEMNKFLTTLLTTALLSLGTASFAADAAKVADPVKAEASASATPTATKAVKKHHHTKKVVEKAAEAPAAAK